MIIAPPSTNEALGPFLSVFCQRRKKKMLKASRVILDSKGERFYGGLVKL